TFMEMVAVDAWKPQWKRWDTFGVSRSAALVVDGLHSTRPVEFTVRAPKDAEAMYDVLTYEKGCSVLRMLEQYLGADVFRAGVRLYLQRHAYRNTQTEDLWNALGAASRQPIPAVMDGWIFQPGYPLLSVDRNGDQLVLRQQRFPSLPAEQGPTTREGEAPAEPDAAARQEPRPPELSRTPAQRWQVPVQVRLMAGGATRVERLLLGEMEARLPL